MFPITNHIHDAGLRRRPELSLYSDAGERKYINAEERVRFLKAAGQADPLTRTLCMLLTYSGCRLSEALAVTAQEIQREAGVISFRTLKRRKAVVREVPIPAILVEQLDQVFGLPLARQHPSDSVDTFCPWKRTWAWMRVKRVMAQADIVGMQASPKGLRHGFGVRAVQSGVPLNLVQKWLGHAQLSTTAIYANAVGPEEYAIAQRMW